MSRNTEIALAIDGQGLYFYFDRRKKFPVLNDANIAVPLGEIYGLLGPSGCGKTTLLKCIIGQHKLQEGSLKVYGRIPGSKGFPIPGRGIGYMPQELGLYFEMTIEEIITYFGSLYGMSRQLVKDRLNFLIELLALPEKKRMIKHLSGGQQRRVSFAIALVHKPPLLILDEPTVGVDPLLRQTIWNHLVTLAKNDHITVLITTHYTEEARQADTAGLMRNGHLIVEKNPEDLIKQHGLVTLEAVFLKICQSISLEHKDHEISHTLDGVEIHNPKSLTKNGTFLKGNIANGQYAEEKHLEKNGQDFNMVTLDSIDKCDGVFDEKNGGPDNTSALLPQSPLPKEFDHASLTAAFFASFLRFICLSRKNVLRLKRNIFMIVLSTLIPTGEIVIFCLCVSSNPFDLNVAVVNMDEDVNKYGEEYLLSLSNRTIHQIRFDNLAAAYESVEKGESWAAIHIGEEFSNCIVDRILEGGLASNDTLLCSAIEVYIDQSNHIISSTIYIDLLTSYLKLAKRLLSQYQKSPLIADPPIHIKEYVYGSADVKIVDFMAPAVLAAVAYIIAIGLTAISVLEEKKTGIVERTFVAGATATEMLISLFFVMVLVLVVQHIVMLTFTFFVFGIPYHGPLFWIAVAVLLVGICGMTYGFLLSTVTEELSTAIIIAVGTFIPTLFLSAVIWPVEAMPYYVRYLSYCLPMTKMIESMRSLMTRGWNVTDHNIWDGYLICSSWIILSMVLSILFLKLKK